MSPLHLRIANLDVFFGGKKEEEEILETQPYMDNN